MHNGFSTYLDIVSGNWSPSIPEIAATPHSFNGIVDGHISAWKQNMIIQKKSQHIYQTIIFPRFFNGLYSNCSVKKKPTQNGAFQSAEGESSERDLLTRLMAKRSIAKACEHPYISTVCRNCFSFHQRVYRVTMNPEHRVIPRFSSLDDDFAISRCPIPDIHQDFVCQVAPFGWKHFYYLISSLEHYQSIIYIVCFK